MIFFFFFYFISFIQLVILFRLIISFFLFFMYTDNGNNWRGSLAIYSIEGAVIISLSLSLNISFRRQIFSFITFPL